MEVGGKKDAPYYIADMIIPLIQKMEKTMDEHNKLCPGVGDLVLFVCVSNVPKAGMILATHFPPISVVHGAEHVVSLFQGCLYKCECINVTVFLFGCCNLTITIICSAIC